MRKIIFLAILLSLSFALFGCLGQGQPPVQQNLTAQYGDNVTVDYTLRVDGKVMDTSLIDVAKQAGIYNQNRSYQPMTFPLLLGNGLINGFVNGILGMKVGESRNFTVAPADGYGLSDPGKISNISRYYNMSVFEEAPMEYFIANNITVKKGVTFPTAQVTSA